MTILTPTIDLNAYVIAPVIVSCLVVAYVIKATPALAKYLKNLIPVIMAVLGAVLTCVDGGVTTENLTAGAITGLLSTGLYESFKGLIEGPKKAETDDNTEKEGAVDDTGTTD